MRYLLVLCLFVGCATKLPKNQVKFEIEKPVKLTFKDVEKKAQMLAFEDRDKVIYQNSEEVELVVRLSRVCIPESVGNVAITYDVNVKQESDKLKMSFKTVAGRHDRITALGGGLAMGMAHKYHYTDYILCSMEQAETVAREIASEIAGE